MYVLQVPVEGVRPPARPGQRGAPTAEATLRRQVPGRRLGGHRGQ